jgi:hypothetical protein
MHENANVESRAEFSALRLILAQLALAAVLGVAFGIAAVWGWQNAGSQGIWAAVVALAACWIPNAISLVVMSLMRDPQQSMAAMMIGMLLRMALPMVFVISLLRSKHWLVDAGLMSMFMAMYLTALLVETGLSLWIVGAFRSQAVKAS